MKPKFNIKDRVVLFCEGPPNDKSNPYWTHHKIAGTIVDVQDDSGSPRYGVKWDNGRVNCCYWEHQLEFFAKFKKTYNKEEQIIL